MESKKELSKIFNELEDFYIDYYYEHRKILKKGINFETRLIVGNFEINNVVLSAINNLDELVASSSFFEYKKNAPIFLEDKLFIEVKCKNKVEFSQEVYLGDFLKTLERKQQEMVLHGDKVKIFLQVRDGKNAEDNFENRMLDITGRFNLILADLRKTIQDNHRNRKMLSIFALLKERMLLWSKKVDHLDIDDLHFVQKIEGQNEINFYYFLCDNFGMAISNENLIKNYIDYKSASIRRLESISKKLQSLS